MPLFFVSTVVVRVAVIVALLFTHPMSLFPVEMITERRLFPKESTTGSAPESEAPIFSILHSQYLPTHCTNMSACVIFLYTRECYSAAEFEIKCPVPVQSLVENKPLEDLPSFDDGRNCYGVLPYPTTCDGTSLKAQLQQIPLFC